MTSTHSHIDAIISLLDDPDPFVQDSIRARLLELGDVAAPALRSLTLSGVETIARFNAEENLREIGLHKFRSEFERLLEKSSNDQDIDLEHGALALSYLRYPEMNGEECTQQLDTMASMLDGRLRNCDNGYMIIREINRYLVDQLGFHGCRSDRESYYNPDNSYINRVLERRIGNPVALSVVYLLVAGRLNVPLFGVGFPSHYILKYRALGEEFYVNPFNGGAILNYSDCRHFLRQLSIDYRPEYLETISNRRTLARMMRNLAEIYRTVEPPLMKELEMMIERVTREEE